MLAFTLNPKDCLPHLVVVLHIHHSIHIALRQLCQNLT
jgi:hypothetical protein